MKKSDGRKLKNKKRTLKNGADMHSNDSLGSYTGVPENENERPIQDADDL